MVRVRPLLELKFNGLTLHLYPGGGRGIGDFRWRSIALIVTAYSLIAVAFITLAYVEPGYKGFVLPQGFMVIFYDGSLELLVATSNNMTVVYSPSGVHGVRGSAVSACYNGTHVLLLLDDSTLYSIRLDSGVSVKARIGLDATWSTLSCSVGSAYVAGVMGDNVVVIDVGRGYEYVLRDLRVADNLKLLPARTGFYVASGSTVALVDKNPRVYRLPEAMTINGLTVAHDGLVAYGTWGESGAIYRFSASEAILLSVPGKRTSVDSMVCNDYWCTSIIRPYGDWLVVVEFNNWRYTSDSRILGVKPFVYHNSGASSTPWFTGEFIGIGVTVLATPSTREATIGFNFTHALAWTERNINPPLRLSKLKIPPIVNPIQVEVRELNIPWVEVETESVTMEVKRVEVQRDILYVVVTMLALASPVLAYLYSYITRSGER